MLRYCWLSDEELEECERIAIERHRRHRDREAREGKANESTNKGVLPISPTERDIRGVIGEMCVQKYFELTRTNLYKFGGDSGEDGFLGPISYDSKYTNQIAGHFCVYDKYPIFKAQIGILVCATFDKHISRIAGFIGKDRFKAKAIKDSLDDPKKPWYVPQTWLADFEELKPWFFDYPHILKIFEREAEQKARNEAIK